MVLLKRTNRVILSCIFLTGIITTMTSPLLTEFSKLCNTNIDTMGIVFTFNTMGYLFFSTLFGVLAQKLNPKKIICALIIGYAMTIFLLPYTRNLIQLCIFFTFIGGGNGSLMSLLTAYMTSINTKETYANVGKIHMSFGIGAILGPVFIIVFNALNLSWQHIYVLLSIILFIIELLFLGAKYENSINVEKFSMDAVKEIFTNKYIIIAAICIALYNGSEVGSWGWLSTNLKTQNISSVISNFAVSIFWISMTIGRGIVNKFSEKYKLKNILFTLIIMSIISNILIMFQFNMIYQVICIFLLGFSYSAICPLFITLGLNKIPDKGDSYTASSILLSSGSIGIMCIPYFIGAGGTIGKYAPLISFVACFILLSYLYKKDK